MSLQDELRNAKQSVKTHEATCQSLIAENKKYRQTLQYIADDSETQTSGHFGMIRLAGYANKTLVGSDWLNEFEKDERIDKLQKALERIATFYDDGESDFSGDTPTSIAKEALEI